jgi:anti-sigma regulatory factor (Ser/Thr protein kinase)
VEPAELIVSELVTNTVRHARTRADLSLTRTARNLHLAVRDYSPDPARLVGPPDPARPGGRGLLIVAAMATNWGSIPTGDGKVTWASLSLLGH